MTGSTTAATAHTAATTHTAATARSGDPQECSGEARPLATVTPLRPEPVRTNRRTRRALMRSEAGLATAEYAIATLAAVGFAALLVAVLSSGEIRGMLMSLITNALSFG
ncbi:hypothetical protein GCM10027404_15880 [Arthrobacter tumbae]|uniref:DUF4244 domain-containing protein n=1 Tax=Arthrobacter tumbae TaxID=163874 RepID=UPI001EF76C98|nr:DUF4244 domain-containing protein [Arthrobacter tumbae]MBM7780638.1 hypothetical protein [Arthrobacter tumbae]